MSRKLLKPSSNSNGVTNMGVRYALTNTQVNSLLTELNTPGGFIDNVAKLFSTPIDNIISLYQFPFDVKALDPVWSALNDVTLIINIVQMSTTGAHLNPLSVPILDLGTATISRYFNNFLDFAPYTKIELYLPYVGFVELDNALVMGKTISIKYVVDFYTGKCTAFILTGSGNDETVIMTRDGTIGMNVQVAGGTGADISRSMLKLGIGAASGAVSLGAGAVSAGAAVNAAGKATGKSVGAVSDMIGKSTGYLGNTTIDAITAGQVNVHKNGSTDANNGFYAPQNAYLIYTRPTIARPTDYNALVGRPSGKTVSLSTLTGYTVVDQIHVEGLSTATSGEIDEVESLLKSGVIL